MRAFRTIAGTMLLGAGPSMPGCASSNQFQSYIQQNSLSIGRKIFLDIYSMVMTDTRLGDINMIPEKKARAYGSMIQFFYDPIHRLGRGVGPKNMLRGIIHIVKGIVKSCQDVLANVFGDLDCTIEREGFGELMPRNDNTCYEPIINFGPMHLIKTLSAKDKATAGSLLMSVMLRGHYSYVTAY